MEMSQQRDQGQGRDWKRIFTEMPFIAFTSNWIKLLLSLLAEPTMFISTLVIIAVTVIPGAASWPLWIAATAKLIMSIGPEIVLPGCFTLAQIARRDGNKTKSSLLFTLCVVFAFLTLVTLASFVWNLSGITGNAILFIRCAAGIGYTIILHIHQAETPHQEPEPALPAPTQEELQQEIQNQVHAVLTPLVQELTTSLQNQFIQFQNQNQPAQVNYEDIVKAVLPHIRRTVISELPSTTTAQLLPEPRRRAAPVPKTREERLESAYQELLANGKTPSGQQLATLAKCNKKTALEWLKERSTEPDTRTGTTDLEPTDGQYNSDTDGQTEPDGEYTEDQEEKDIAAEYQVLEPTI